MRAGSVLVALSLCAAACDGTPDARQRLVRILPLGDSITEAEGGHASYRYWLQKSLAALGKPVDFVGSQAGVYGGLPRHPDFDLDHEGHWGWTTAEVREQIEGWARAARADVALLMLGTNDGARNLPATRENLAAIVASLRRARPGCAVLLAQVPPAMIAGRRWGDVPLLNQAIAELAAELHRADAPVVLVDQHTGFDPARDSYDGLHANERGEQKLARRWHDALIALDPWRGP